MEYLLAIDQGTSSSRTLLLGRDGQLHAQAQREFTQIYPRPGWVEHDPREIWASQRDTLTKVLQQAAVAPSAVAALGITNQRETTLVWRRSDGVPIYNAIVWQDRRSEPLCALLREQGHEALIQSRTGLRIDAYFSATKLRWILDHVEGARQQAERGELAFGTVDSWLIWQLTAGRVHATDVSNASRTMLFDIHRNVWDEELLELLRIPKQMMPQVQSSSADFGQVQAACLIDNAAQVQWPIGGVAGDQQAALFGQACFTAGQAKNTYGTGCFMLMHTGERCLQSHNGLISTSAAQTQATPQFALEGSVFIGGAVVQWLRDGLGAINSSAEIEALAQSVPDSGGVIFVPAFTGLGAPYWLPNARGSIQGLTRGSTVAHIARAALESIALQSTALLEAMNADAQQHGVSAVQELRVDGGACANNLLMQMQADLLGIAVVRPANVETTALGAAYLAGLQSGLFQDQADIASHWRIERRFEPQWSRDQAQDLLNRWNQAVNPSA